MPPAKLPGKVAKKSAKKVAAKAAKKVAKKAEKKGAKSPGRDLRRGYEHLHRLHALSSILAEDSLQQVQLLASYAQSAFRADKPKAAADLLRAAEHLAFASIGSAETDDALAKPVRQELKDELEHLLDRASTDWEAQDAPRALRRVYKEARRGAKDAWKAKTFGRALEFARAADALAHAKADKLPAPEETHTMLRLPEMVSPEA